MRLRGTGQLPRRRKVRLNVVCTDADRILNSAVSERLRHQSRHSSGNETSLTPPCLLWRHRITSGVGTYLRLRISSNKVTVPVVTSAETICACQPAVNAMKTRPEHIVITLLKSTCSKSELFSSSGSWKGFLDAQGYFSFCMYTYILTCLLTWFKYLSLWPHVSLFFMRIIVQYHCHLIFRVDNIAIMNLIAWNIFTARCTLVLRAVLRSHVVCLSVCQWRLWIVIT